MVSDIKIKIFLYVFIDGFRLDKQWYERFQA